MTDGFPKRLLPALLWMAVIFGLSSFHTVPKPKNLTSDLVNIAGHFGAYLILGVLVWWALGLWLPAGRDRALIAVVLATLYGVSDEWHQSFVPDRRPDVIDVIVDCIGACVGLALLRFATHLQSTRSAPARNTPQMADRPAPAVQVPPR